MILDFTTFLLMISIVRGSGLPYNRPYLSADSTWNGNASTLANNGTVGEKPHAIFIDREKIFYFVHQQQMQIRWWPLNQSVASYQSFPFSVQTQYAPLFVSAERDIYAESAAAPGCIVSRLMINSTMNQAIFQFASSCLGLFIDLNDTLYCSIYFSNHVDAVSLHGDRNSSIIRAGTGGNGNGSDQLATPWGIFVDTNFDLYVADSYNYRIQRFSQGNSTGTTVAGRGIPNSLSLQFPTDVILDGNNQIYIADNQHSRIVRVRSTDFDCLVGCSGSQGVRADQQINPYSLRFDSYGNLYVADEWNHRIQKFALQNNSYPTSNLFR